MVSQFLQHSIFLFLVNLICIKKRDFAFDVSKMSYVEPVSKGSIGCL